MVYKIQLSMCIYTIYASTQSAMADNNTAVGSRDKTGLFWFQGQNRFILTGGAEQVGACKNYRLPSDV